MADARFLTLRQVLSWNEKWSYTDRELIQRALATFDRPEYYIPPSGGYIRYGWTGASSAASGLGTSGGPMSGWPRDWTPRLSHPSSTPHPTASPRCR